MKEYIFENWVLTEKQCIKIKEKLEGKSYMDFHIGWSNWAGNCTLIVKTDYKDSPAKIKDFFLYCAVTALAD